MPNTTPLRAPDNAKNYWDDFRPSDPSSGGQFPVYITAPVAQPPRNLLLSCVSAVADKFVAPYFIAESSPSYPIVVKGTGVSFKIKDMAVGQLYVYKVGDARMVAKRNDRGGVDLFEIS